MQNFSLLQNFNQNDLTNSEPVRADNVSTNFEFKFTSKFERQVI